jgi:hypothetical protein
MEAKLKHLEFLQNVITRMANNSFMLKGWIITILGVILGLNKDDVDYKIVIVGIFLTVMFWVLDAYFLKQERYFRKRYDEVREQEVEKIDFSMALETKDNLQDLDWFSVFFSVTLRLYYLSLIGSLFLFGMVL